ncbi:MAG: DUF697 domain-containing protein [Cyanobacteria bacterium P01_H01_bin.130]
MWVALDVTQSVLTNVGDWLPLGLAAAGAGIWLAGKGKSPKAVAPRNIGLGRSQVDQLLSLTQKRLAVLTAEKPDDAAIDGWRAELEKITADLDWREQMTARSLVVLGGRSTGKSTLIPTLPRETAGLTLDWSELPALFDDEGTDPAENLARAAAADGVMLVLAGDMTASEFEVLQQLCHADDGAGLQGTPCAPFVVVNKRDQWLPEEEKAVLDRIRQRLNGVIPAERIMPAAAAPRQLKARQHQTDGSVIERLEQPEPAIAAVSDGIQQWVKAETDQLHWGAPMRRLHVILQGVQGELNEVRRSRSLTAIEQSQWIAAAAAFANPVPGLDLVATAAVNGQLVMDLGQVYQLSFDLERASAIAKTFGELMVKLGLVELSSQVVAGALKTNAMTYVAGGALQAMSAAYLTRVAGLTLVTLFEAQSERIAIAGETDEKWLSSDRIATVLQATFNRVRDGVSWNEFLTQAAQRLSLTAA